MKFSHFIFGILTFVPAIANAGEWFFDIEGHAQGLYGYSDAKKHHTGTGQGNVDTSVTYLFEDQSSLSFHLDMMLGINQEIQDYNQGRWGEEAYTIYDSAYGQLMIGQVFNAASLFHNGVTNVGAFTSNNDIADFIMNPNWQRDSKETRFSTLNSTDINTDGVAPKINYISPEFYGTALGFSYMPDSYNRRGLVNKHANYAHNDGFVGAIYNDYDWGSVSSQMSFGYAQYHGNDKEFSYSLNLKRGNWNIGGGYRKTYIDGDNKLKTNTSLPIDFDGYREGTAWNLGIGYELGPISSSLSYFESKSNNSNYENKIIAFSNKYRLNKTIDIYLAAAHVNYSEKFFDEKGYTVVTGVGVNF